VTAVDPFAIVCDSSHDLPPEVVDKLRLTVVPYTINFGAESSLDDGVMALEEFAELLDRYEKGKGYPTTAAPAPSRFVEVFLSHIRQGLPRILIVTISSKLSKTYDAAIQAARMVEEDYPDSQIKVVDSLGLSMVEGMLLVEAARARELGRPLEEARLLVEEMRGRVRILAALETTKYLVKSGRARRLEHVLGTFLQIKPIITAKDGATALYARVQGGMERAIDRMVHEVQRTYKSGTVAVVEGIAPDLGGALVGKLCQRLGVERETILQTKTTPTLMLHWGKRVVGVVWEQEPQSA
jgi:DegV family protein with EDD domain